MKNNTSFSDEEIKGIVDLMETEFPTLDITEWKIINIASRMEGIGFKPEDKLLALEFSARLRFRMARYIDGCKENKSDLIRKQYNTIEGQVIRVKNTMYPYNIDPKELYEINNSDIKEIAEDVLSDLEEVMKMKNRKPVNMDEIDKSVLIQKKIIKKRLGL